MMKQDSKEMMTGTERLTLIGSLDEGASKLGGMAHELRAKLLSLV
jgi:hypothetical protein